MLPEVSTEFGHTQEFFELLVFLFEFLVVNVLFHLGKVTNRQTSFKISGYRLALTNPVGNSSISFDTIDFCSLVTVEFTTQYFINNLLFKPFRIEQLLCPMPDNALFFTHFFVLFLVDLSTFLESTYFRTIQNSSQRSALAKCGEFIARPPGADDD